MLPEETQNDLAEGNSNKSEMKQEEQKTTIVVTDYEAVIRAIYSDDSHRYSGLIDED